MKRIVYAVLATVSGLVLLFSYRTSWGEGASIAGTATGASGTGATGSGAGSSSSGSGSAGTSSPESSSSSSSSGSSSSGSSAPSSGSGLKDGSYTGRQAQTRYGPVQVAITVSGGRITRVTVPEYPTGSGRDQEINSYAVPQLVSETTSAQSARIDMVSGATFTSQGYVQSLQSALDRAKG